MEASRLHRWMRSFIIATGSCVLTSAVFLLVLKVGFVVVPRISTAVEYLLLRNESSHSFTFTIIPVSASSAPLQCNISTATVPAGAWQSARIPLSVPVVYEDVHLIVWAAPVGKQAGSEAQLFNLHYPDMQAFWDEGFTSGIPFWWGEIVLKDRVRGSYTRGNTRREGIEGIVVSPGHGTSPHPE